MPLSYKGIMIVKANEYFKIDGMTAYNINTATFVKTLKTGVNYLSLTAAVLIFDTFSAISSTTTYTVNSLTVYHTFSKESTAVRITPLATTLNPHIMSIFIHWFEHKPTRLLHQRDVFMLHQMCIYP